MSDPFLAEIVLFAGNFAPQGWAFCDGQVLPISQNTALFSLLGTTYGGNGTTTFALPDLRGRAPMHSGSGAGPGLSSRPLGGTGGAEQVTLTPAQLPPHVHPTSVASGEQTTNRPQNGVPARGGVYGTADAAGPPGGANAGNQPHENMPPFLVLNYIIALQGIFPSRS